MASALDQGPLPPDSGPVAALELRRWLRDPCKLMDECRARHGDAFTLRIPRMPVVLVWRPEAVKDVFGLGPDAAHAGKANALLKPFLGEHSLLLLDGAEHLRQRKMMLPAFPRPADAGVRSSATRSGAGARAERILDARDEAGVPLSEDEVHDELLTLLAAGHETTATALAWTLRWVLPDEALLRDLRAELATAEGDPARIAKLELLDGTVKEALRLQPVFAMVARTLRDPVRRRAAKVRRRRVRGLRDEDGPRRPAPAGGPAARDEGGADGAARGHAHAGGGAAGDRRGEAGAGGGRGVATLDGPARRG